MLLIGSIMTGSSARSLNIELGKTTSNLWVEQESMVVIPGGLYENEAFEK